MRTILVGLALLASFSLPQMVEAQQDIPPSYVEGQNLYNDRDLKQQGIGYVYRDVGDKGFGIFGFLLATKEWGQAYAGPAYSPTPWSSISAGVGWESSDGHWRTAVVAWLGNDRLESLNIFEEGASGFWHKNTFNVMLNDVLGAGFHWESFVGIGPRGQINVPGLPIILWGALTFHHKENIAAFATAQYHFSL